ncbi:MAG: hypothetical protein KZY61_06400 [Clostridiaceae bacterium]|nr:hypothetical protein [Clostridiaceae bacterium]MBW4858584.1 hypothetical protein [Clostridiaceae bacterium]MBW4868278.1 hypothetical protein [Clostridiaceae bacterium]
MDNNDELRKSLEKIGNVEVTDEQMENIKQAAEDYSNKSDDEIFFEIIKLNEKMEDSMEPEEYEDLLERLEKIRPLLNEEQIERLDKLLDVLKGDR